MPMPRKIRVLRVVIGLNQGGVQQGVLNLFRGLDPNRYEAIACAIENTGAIGKEIEAAGFEVIVLGYKREMWKTINAIVKLIKEREIDIVHASSYHPSLYARIAGVIARAPVILSYEHVVFENKRMPRVFANKLLDYFTDGYTAVGEAVFKQVVDWYRYSPEKVHIIHNGVDTERFYPIENKLNIKTKLELSLDKPVIGMVSRLNKEKGHRFLFEAIACLREEFDVQWLIIGTGREDALIKQQAKDAGVDDCVLFMGLRRDIPDLLRALDIFVFPTLQEGFPNVLLEAMASGCAVVASDFSGNLEVAEHERNALIVQMADSLALSVAIKRLLTSSEYARELAKQARMDIVNNFSLQAYVGNMSKYYEQLCLDKGRV